MIDSIAPLLSSRWRHGRHLAGAGSRSEYRDAPTVAAVASEREFIHPCWVAGSTLAGPGPRQRILGPYFVGYLKCCIA